MKKLKLYCAVTWWVG